MATRRRCTETGDDAATDWCDGEATARAGSATRGTPEAPGPAARISSARSSCGSCPAGVSAGNGTTTLGVMPVPWIQVWLGVSHLAMDSRKPPESPDS